MKTRKHYDDDIGYYYITAYATDKSQLDAVTEFMIIELEDSQPFDKTKKHIYDNFQRSCGCAHDCCGHWFGGANEVINLGDDRILILSSYAKNY